MSPTPLAITITRLEMRARPAALRPALPHGHDNGRVMLLRARKPPVHFYRYLYETVGKAYHWVDRCRMDDETLRTNIHDDNVDVFVMYCDGVPAGYFELDFRQPDEAELVYLGLLPEYVGRGLGSFLLATAIDHAWSKPINRVWVHTNTLDHPRALPTYQRMGFVPFAQEKATITPLD